MLLCQTLKNHDFIAIIFNLAPQFSFGHLSGSENSEEKDEERGDAAVTEIVIFVPSIQLRLASEAARSDTDVVC